MNQILVMGKVHVEVKLVAFKFDLELGVEKARLPSYPVAGNNP